MAEIVGVSNSFTGLAQALEIIGDHCYAYNNLAANTTSAPVMSFTSGNYYADTILQVNMALAYPGGQDNISYLQCKFNGGVVSLLVAGKLSDDSRMQATTALIIPPYTEVEINLVSNGADATRLITVGITGRIYR